MTQEQNDTNTQALVPSPMANQARVRFTGNTVIFDWVPRWLLTAASLPSQMPIQVTAEAVPEHPLSALAVVAVDVLQQRMPVHEWLTEIDVADDARMALLVDAKLENGGAPVVTLLLQEVTEIIRQRRRAAAVGSYHGLIGRSLAMLEVFRRIELYGPTEGPVIVTGETGTGKELVARALHQRSPRGEGPYVAVNCTALTPELFESELFGHEKGAFTGAVRQHRGRFERADKGTLFLDEIGDMPLYTQSKLLRALEEGVVERVGGEAEHPVDVRVIAATNVALEQSVAAGRFRPDLYHRLSVFRIHLPPLRERTGDIPLLVNFFIEYFNRRYNKSIRRMTPEALRVLEQYSWPGNVRELRNVMERVFVETTGEAIGSKALATWISERDYLMPGDWNVDGAYAPRPPIITQFQERDTPAPQSVRRERDMLTRQEQNLPRRGSTLSIPDETLVIEPATFSGTAKQLVQSKPELNAELIKQVFEETGGNITEAARRLGLHKATFYRHMKRLGLSRQELEENIDQEEAPHG